MTKKAKTQTGTTGEIARATLSHIRMSPRKARLVIDLIRGKKVEPALNILRYSPKKGAAFAKKLVRRFPHGVCLIVVAGMEYAAHVKNKGYDVLDSSELLADRIVPSMLKQLGFT